ncbi:MAG: hypothetical protein U0798_01295 [Gemmataceae bacterium]
MRHILLSFLLFGTAVWAVDPPQATKSVKPIFKMSKETTVILDPLDEEGYPDYLTALNQHLRGTIKPQDNACVKLWQALGPITESGNPIPAAYWKWLECEAPPEKGDYFISSSMFFENSDQKEAAKADFRKSNLLIREPWSAAEQPDYANWLKSIEKPLDLAVEAVQRKSFFSPVVMPDEKTRSNLLSCMLLPNYQRCRDLGKALMIRAMLRTRQNQLEGAWKDIQACHRLARHIACGAGQVELLSGLALEMMSCWADVAFLEHGKPNGDWLSRVRNDLELLPPMPSAIEKLEHSDLYSCLDFACHVRHDGIELLEKFSAVKEEKPIPPELNHALDGMNWSETFRIINRGYGRMASAMRIADRPARMNALKEYDESVKTMKAEVVNSYANWEKNIREKKVDGDMGELTGKILMNLFASSNRGTLQASEQGIQTLALTKLAFALAAYHEAKGAYPDKLDQLVPTYMKSMPVDLYSGKVPIYRKTEKGYIVYSVGENGKDDGGFLRTDGEKDGKRGDDIGIRMPAK